MPAVLGTRCAAPTSRALRRGPSATATSGLSTAEGVDFTRTTADFGLLLARTRPRRAGAPRPEMFLVDMQPQVLTSRLLRQMTGHAQFNEVYLDGVRLGADAQLGPEGKGWQVATTTLMNERVAIGRSMATMASPAEHRGSALPGAERARPGPAPARFAGMWIESEIGRLITERAGQLGQTGDPGPVGSVGKLFGAEHAFFESTISSWISLGPDGMLYPRFGDNGAPMEHAPQVAFLRARCEHHRGRHL